MISFFSPKGARGMTRSRNDFGVALGDGDSANELDHVERVYSTILQFCLVGQKKSQSVLVRARQ
jgi:hypothetical protein